MGTLNYFSVFSHILLGLIKFDSTKIIFGNEGEYPSNKLDKTQYIRSLQSLSVKNWLNQG